jgi:hypothetical protein
MCSMVRAILWCTALARSRIFLLTLSSRIRWSRPCEHDHVGAPVFDAWTEESMGLERLFDVRDHVLAALHAWV